MLSEGFVAAVLAGMEDTLDELIEVAPSEAVRSELVRLEDDIQRVSSMLDQEPSSNSSRGSLLQNPPYDCVFRGMPITVPGSCRSRFRNHADQDSGMMSITIPG